MDRVLRWYIDGNIARTKTQVGGTHQLDADYRAKRINMTCRIASSGVIATGIDILDDGVSILEYMPSLNAGLTHKTWTTIPQTILRKNSVMTLDIVSIADQDTCRDLTVELELEKV